MVMATMRSAFGLQSPVFLPFLPFESRRYEHRWNRGMFHAHRLSKLVGVEPIPAVFMMVELNSGPLCCEAAVLTTTAQGRFMTRRKNLLNPCPDTQMNGGNDYFSSTKPD